MNTATIWIILIVTLLVLMCASTVSFALRAPFRTRLGDFLAKTGREEELKQLVAQLPQLVLTNAALRFASFIAVLFCTMMLVEQGGAQSMPWRYGLSFLIAFPVLLIFGVAVPTAWARYAGEPLLAFMIPIIRTLGVILKPLVFGLYAFDGLVRRLSGVPLTAAESHARELEREILSVVSEGEMHGAVDEEEKEMIESVIDLRETTAEAIMTPRTEVIAAGLDVSLDDLTKLIVESGHSRVPIYGESIDDVQGVLYAKDLLTLSEPNSFSVSDVMRPALYIPETKLLRDLLREFRQQKVHIAVVLDEYGGTAGLITIEDILEELVGEISDEYEDDEPEGIHRLDSSNVEVDARMRIDELNDELDLDLPEDQDYETIGGYVFSTMGKIPSVGESCAHDDLAIRVIAAEPRRITRLRLTLPLKNGDPNPE